MSDTQDQDSATGSQSLVQQILSASDFAEHRARCLAFFQDDAAQFESKVSSEVIIQVKRIFKLIKELDPQAFKLLKSMRTAIGLLDKSERDNIHLALKGIRTNLQIGKLTASAAHALIYLLVLETFRCAYIAFIPDLPKNAGAPNPSFIKKLVQNPQAAYRARCFANAYLLLIADCDPDQWSLIVADDDEPPQIILTRDWALANIQLEAIEHLADPTEA